MRTAAGRLIGEELPGFACKFPLSCWLMEPLGMVPGGGGFFQDQRAYYTKAFWSAHKDFYEASVREPMAGTA